MDDFTEKTISTKDVYKGKVFTVKSDAVQLSNGHVSQRDIVLHSGGVVIVAEKDNKILLVKQYRYAVQEALLELPAGKLEIEENPFEAAKRELREETGYVATKWSDLGFIYTSPGICSEKLYFYKASELEFVGEEPDENEILSYFEFEIDKVFQMIKTGIINDSKTICALMRAYKL